jgi:hypothetical protein
MYNTFNRSSTNAISQKISCQLHKVLYYKLQKKGGYKQQVGAINTRPPDRLDGKCGPDRGLQVAQENTVMRRLMTGINSEKGVVRQFRHCANVIECNYTNLDSIAYKTPGLYGIPYCS